MTLHDFADFHSRWITPPGFFKQILLVHGCQIATIIHVSRQITNGKENYSRLLACSCNYGESRKLIDMPPVQQNATRGIDMMKTRKTWQRPALVRMDAADAESFALAYNRDTYRRQMGPS
jgi:hypothetical protein